MEQKFYKCAHCGNMVAAIKVEGCPIMCCGKEMQQIVPGTSDGAHEKHVPVCAVEGNKVTVTVGAVEHPMVEAHYIEWISIQTRQGNQRKELKPGEPPKACFMLCEGDELIAAYAYCNLHSLWKS